MVANRRRKTEGGVVQGISELIRQQSDVLGRSYRELEAISERSGYKVAYTQFGRWVSPGPKSWPTPDSVRGIAAALEVPQETVVLAFAASLGIDLKQGVSFANQIPSGADELSPDMQSAILRLIRTAIHEGSGEHEQRSTADEQAAGSAAPESKDEVALAARSFEAAGRPAHEPDTDYDNWGA